MRHPGIGGGERNLFPSRSGVLKDSSLSQGPGFSLFDFISFVDLYRFILNLAKRTRFQIPFLGEGRRAPPHCARSVGSSGAHVSHTPAPPGRRDVRNETLVSHVDIVSVFIRDLRSIVWSLRSRFLKGGPHRTFHVRFCTVYRLACMTRRGRKRKN